MFLTNVKKKNLRFFFSDNSAVCNNEKKIDISFLVLFLSFCAHEKNPENTFTLRALLLYIQLKNFFFFASYAKEVI